MSPRDSSDDEDGNLSSSTSSSGDSSSSSTSGREEIPFQPPQQLLDQYQALLSQTIDIPNLILAGLLPTQPLGDDDEMDGGKMMTKAEKQNAKKKRRKEREREAKSALQGISGVGDGQVEAEKATSFRLFSSCPIRNIKLEDKPEQYTCPSNPRHNATSEEEKTRRRIMAESSSVDFSSLGGPSTLAERWSRTSRSIRPLITDSLFDSINLILLEVGPDHKSTHTTQNRPGQSRPIPLLEAHPSSMKRGTRRSRKGKRKRSRAEAAYYCPSDELGGKSQMTLWGHGVGMPVRSRR